MKNLWNVQMPWAWSGDASDEEGTYTTTVEADDEDAARRAAAIEMADSGEKEFSGAEERQRYIDSRASGWADVYRSQDQLAQDLSALFADELFPDGIVRQVNFKALAGLLAANRDELVKAPGSSEVDTAAGTVRSFSNDEILGELQRRGALSQLHGAIGALYDHLDRNGSLSADSSMTAYLAYRLRREKAAICPTHDRQDLVAAWQQSIDELESAEPKQRSAP